MAAESAGWSDSRRSSRNQTMEVEVAMRDVYTEGSWETNKILLEPADGRGRRDCPGGKRKCV